MRTTDAAVLRKANATVGIEVTCLDLMNGCFYKMAEFPTLLFRNRRFEVLDFWRMLSHEHNQRDVGDPANPGIADELGIERKQAFRVFGITTRGSLPID